MWDSRVPGTTKSGGTFASEWWRNVKSIIWFDTFKSSVRLIFSVVSDSPLLCADLRQMNVNIVYSIVTETYVERRISLNVVFFCRLSSRFVFWCVYWRLSRITLPRFRWLFQLFRDLINEECNWDCWESSARAARENSRQSVGVQWLSVEWLAAADDSIFCI